MLLLLDEYRKNGDASLEGLRCALANVQSIELPHKTKESTRAEMVINNFLYRTAQSWGEAMGGSLEGNHIGSQRYGVGAPGLEEQGKLEHDQL